MTNRLAVITGAQGFLGRHTARYFDLQGWDVIGIGHGGWTHDEWRTWGLKEWHPCDITLETLLIYARVPDVLIHCAGGGLVSFSMTHPVQDFRRTVETTLSVLEFTRLHAPQTRIVLPSSAAVYGLADSLPIKEDAPLRPMSPYGLHKKIAEDLCRSYCRHFRIAATLVRFFSVYGSELRKQLLWDACHKAWRRQCEFPGTGEESRDWLNVHDAVALFRFAAEHAAPDCPVVNGGTGVAVTVRDVVGEVFDALGAAQVPYFNGITRPGDPSHYHADITLARSWGWAPRIDWRSSVHEYVQWFKKDVG